MPILTPKLFAQHFHSTGNLHVPSSARSLSAPSDMASYVRENLRDHAGASNLALNERVREMIADGRDLAHFGFGQAPFPPMELAMKALQDNVHKTAYESVQGTYICF